ncbi:MAG TPA: hypothetical protein DCE42_29155 [Myxococcales bacterium]|nr:hypothetical protein [Deltaproteobacteria bacterium]MBU48247.1 hypothetical protein [Deltaproteobacteria bacterium]HAA58867.1 hypothetical protein [Myxococcales bacterium]|tara:strand:+ start:18479 stop:18925 length:447 start_codon:yes stop_codon:yes gene_type:complete
MVRWFFMCLFLLSLFACGGGVPSPQVRLQALDLEKVTFADFVVFSSKLTCAQISQENYLSESPNTKNARLFCQPIKVADKTLWLKDLPVGNDLVVFVVGITLENNQKKIVATGCVDRVQFAEGQLASLDIKMLDVTPTPATNGCPSGS